MTPLLLDQFGIAYGKDRPMGVVFWGYVSDEGRPAPPLRQSPHAPAGLEERDKLWIVEVLAPLGGTNEMLKHLKAKVFKDREMRFRAVEGGKGVVRVMEGWY
jgi:cytolysin-activating lysine-acyltransferase